MLECVNGTLEGSPSLCMGFACMLTDRLLARDGHAHDGADEQAITGRSSSLGTRGTTSSEGCSMSSNQSVDFDSNFTADEQKNSRPESPRVGRANLAGTLLCKQPPRVWPGPRLRVHTG
jgi:hypothetical protein